MSDEWIRVLLVEDNAGDARLVQESLREAGGGEFRLVHAQRLSEALRLLGKEHFDAVLLDLSLPDSQGIETFTEAHAKSPSVPILVLTGLGDERLALEAVRQGAQDYLVKGEVGGNRLVRALRYAIERHRRPPEGALRDGLSKIFHVLQRSGLRVTENRLDDLISAVAARSKAVGDPSVDKYFDRLTARGMDDKEFRELVKVLTVGETQFFRTPNHMWAFRDELLPQVLEARQSGAAPGEALRPVTIWSAGCATGEEPYSLALLIAENRSRFGRHRFRILGTDINEDSLKVARAGVYDERSVRSLPGGYLESRFAREGDKYVLSPEIKRLVEFQYHNLLDAALPFPIGSPGSVDIIFCRNVFIYFSDEIVNAIAGRFFDALIPGGFLVVGHAETLDQRETGFEMVFLSGAYIYRKPAVGREEARAQAPPVEKARPRKRQAARATEKKPAAEEKPGVTGGLLRRSPMARPGPGEGGSDADGMAEEARVSADKGDYREAVRMAKEALRIDEGNPRAHCVIGLVCWSMGSIEEAYLGEAHRREGRAEDAARMYAEAAEILERKPPDDPVWGSETVTNAGLAAMCKAAAERAERRTP